MSDHMTMGAGVGRAAMVGATAGLVGMALLATGGFCLAGLELVDAAAVGICAAVWGGSGFGALFGAVAAIHRNDLEAQVVPVTATGPGRLGSSHERLPERSSR